MTKTTANITIGTLILNEIFMSISDKNGRQQDIWT